MADLTRDIIYRDFTLNDEDIADNVTPPNTTGGGITGCVVDTFDFSDVDILQFIEKRSQADGMDAGDVFKGMRRLRMSGTLYGLTRALLFDNLLAFRAAMDPVLAQREEPLDKGYRPLYFSVPTNRIADYPDGVIELQIKALPRAIQTLEQRSAMGGEDSAALAIPWQATMVCKDPSIMAADPQDTDLSNVATNSGTATNRGNYLCPVNMLIEVGSAAGSLSVVVGDSVFTISVPSSTGNRIIRVKGEDKMLTVEENSVEVPRFDLITFSSDTTWPLIDPGDSAWSVTKTGVTIVAGSHWWFYERYA